MNTRHNTIVYRVDFEPNEKFKTQYILWFLYIKKGAYKV